MTRREHLVQILLLDVGELKAMIIRIHAVNLLRGGGPQHFDDLDHLVHVVLPREERSARQKLGHHAGSTPHVDGYGVVGGSENEFRRAVIARANVGDVRLVGRETLRAAKVADLDDVCLGVDEDVLGLDIAVTDAERMHVRQALKHLIGV